MSTLTSPGTEKPKFEETKAKENAIVKAGDDYSVGQGFHSQDKVERIDFC